MSINSVIVRLAFRRHSDQIHVGLTQGNNVTLTGEVVWSTDLEVSTYQTITTLNSENAIGKVGIICLPDFNYAENIINKINSIQEARPVNARGNKYPFVFAKVQITDDVIFNQGLNNDPDRLTILGVEHIEVSADAPIELLNLNRRVEQPVVNTLRATNTISWYERKRQSSPLNKMSELSRSNGSNRTATPDGRRPRTTHEFIERSAKGLNLSSTPF